MDPITVGGAITAGHHAISLLKGITEAIKASGKAEALNDVIELQMAMLEILAKQHQLTLEAAQLHGRIKELEGQLALSRNLTVDGEVYWIKKDGERDGPFCPVCHDKDDKLVRLHDGRRRGFETRWCCLVCQSAWEGS